MATMVAEAERDSRRVTTVASILDLLTPGSAVNMNEGRCAVKQAGPGFPRNRVRSPPECLLLYISQSFVLMKDSLLDGRACRLESPLSQNEFDQRARN